MLSTRTGMVVRIGLLLLLVGVSPVNAFSSRMSSTTTTRHPVQRPRAAAAASAAAAGTSRPLFYQQHHHQQPPPHAETALRASGRTSAKTPKLHLVPLSTGVAEPLTPPLTGVETNAATAVLAEVRPSRSIDTQKVVGGGVLEQILSSYWGVRALLLVIPAIYGTNFALGSSLNDALANPALTTALRMTLASLAVFPWLVKINVTTLLLPAILTGLCSATGYIGQSIALNDVDPARVSFLGAAVVVWCPILEALFDQRPFTGQTWLAAGLCMTGVAILEGVVGGSGGVASALTLANGDAWALLQAVGFGTQCYLCSKFITDDNRDQVIPFTAVLVTVTAVTAWIWYGLTMSSAAGAGGLLSSLPSVPSSVWLALAWTGLISTSANFALEVAALGRVPSSEATVFLSTEPIWAAIFAAVLLGNTMTYNEYVGGSLMILACLVSSVSLDDTKGYFSRAENGLKPPPDEITVGR